MKQDEIVPALFYSNLHRYIHFTLDAAADVFNRKHVNYFGPDSSLGEDAFYADWGNNVVWINPPTTNKTWCDLINRWGDGFFANARINKSLVVAYLDFLRDGWFHDLVTSSCSHLFLIDDTDKCVAVWAKNKLPRGPYRLTQNGEAVDSKSADALVDIERQTRIYLAKHSNNSFNTNRSTCVHGAVL